MAVARTQRRKRRPKEPSVAYPPPIPNIELIEGDDEPLESDWHRLQMNLLIELVHQLWKGRTDFFCGGNMFIYYSIEQAESVRQGRPLYKGPDFFVVKDVDGTKMRKYWVVWEEGGRYPNLILELISPKTAYKDRHDNMELYAETFGTREYFWYDPDKDELKGFRLQGSRYQPIEPNERGWLWSEELGAWLGRWQGSILGRNTTWIRLYDSEGRLVPTIAEEAERERQRAEQLAQRLRELGIEPDNGTE